MPRDIVAERKHRHELRRQAVRKTEHKKGPGRKKGFRATGAESDPCPPHAVRPFRGPKKFKWKRDVLNKMP